MGIINAGTAIGAVVAPPLIAAVILSASWRWAFFVCGVAGLAWTLWWVWEYQPPAQHRRLSAAERETIAEVFDASAAAAPAMSWGSLLTLRQVWGLVLAKFLTDGAWYFYLFWLPKHLYDARGFDVKQVGYYAWIPYAAAGVGSLIGGWFSSVSCPTTTSSRLPLRSGTLIDTTIAPYVIARTSIPLALVSVKILIGVPSGIVPNGASVTPAAVLTSALPKAPLAGIHRFSTAVRPQCPNPAIAAAIAAPRHLPGQLDKRHTLARQRERQ
jgi:MFS family permease